MDFSRAQDLNTWFRMLHDIYGQTQNYGKTEYEIYTHLAEVSGAFGKYLLKRKQFRKAQEFLPKMFAWTMALIKRVKGRDADSEKLLLAKCPGMCPYCSEAACVCWRQKDKPRLNEQKVREAYYRLPTTPRGVNDFQRMYRTIYGDSWGVSDPEMTEDAVLSALRTLYTRLFEELGEIAEAIRYHHLYPSNFDNEVADYLAWWFALVSSLHRLQGPHEPMILAEDLLWTAYPGYCLICGLAPCQCVSGPVRELLSKPSLFDLANLDGLTQARNQAAFGTDLADISADRYPVATPIACVRLDLDDFKTVNDDYDHTVGDEALKYVVEVLRRKCRLRDRLYRVGGDEFALLCSDLSAEEAEGMMNRVLRNIRESPLSTRFQESEVDVPLSLSIGISECARVSELKEAFMRADEAAIKSKKAGKARVTVCGPQGALGS